uniref:Uncharacterized protein n=1 Tax=Nicotiana tabacum TaxID=4097 RepID=A0A1S3ZZ52_TOBAC|nr:PREDICTED: uncharacterized protein LOC107791979 [Nicotiana tabacum]
MERYKLARKQAKLVVTAAKTATFSRLYEKLEGKGWDKLIFRQIRVEEVVGAMHKMSRSRATGPDKFLVEFWKSVGRAGLEWLTTLFNVIFMMKKMLEEWRWGAMVPLYKNKGDIKKLQ